MSSLSRCSYLHLITLPRSLPCSFFRKCLRGKFILNRIQALVSHSTAFVLLFLLLITEAHSHTPHINTSHTHPSSLPPFLPPSLPHSLPHTQTIQIYLLLLLPLLLLLLLQLLLLLHVLPKLLLSVCRSSSSLPPSSTRSRERRKEEEEAGVRETPFLYPLSSTVAAAAAAAK